MSRHLEDIGNLSWSRDPETQKNAAMNLLAADDWDCENCIIGTEKDVWENLVAVIEKTGRGTKKTLCRDLLFLLQDLNWPGALRAREIVKGMSKDDVLRPLQEALLQAYATNDGIWISNLKSLVDYFGYGGESFQDMNLAAILEKAEW